MCWSFPGLDSRHKFLGSTVYSGLKEGIRQIKVSLSVLHLRDLTDRGKTVLPSSSHPSAQSSSASLGIMLTVNYPDGHLTHRGTEGAHIHAPRTPAFEHPLSAVKLKAIPAPAFNKHLLHLQISLFKDSQRDAHGWWYR